MRARKGEIERGWGTEGERKRVRDGRGRKGGTGGLQVNGNSYG